MHDQQAQGEPVVVPARAMIYYDARKLEGTTGQDVGAEVRDAVKGIANWGVCPDSEFPYSDQVYDKAPSKQDYADASKQEAIVYQAVNYPHLNQTLASGFPFVFGFTVYESFEGDEVARTGVVPMPGPGERVVGGHCVWAWGYNDQRTGSFQGIPPRSKACRNSWGEGWGDHGNFYLPQGYFDAGLCSDFWIIKRLGAK
jgi:C1A family cysteine protease